MAQASVQELEHTGLAEKERVASVPHGEQLASTPEPPFPKGKEQSCQSRALYREGERVKVSESCTLERKSEIRARA